MTNKRDQRRRTRRSFLEAGLIAGASAIAPCFVPSRVLGKRGQPGANDRIHVGVIGVGVRGKYLIGSLPEIGRVTAICDCARWRMGETLEPKRRYAQVLAAFRERDAGRCATYQDYRQMLDREKLDAVIIATPDHHHVLAAMLACEAGLDVYVEKPLSLTIAEGRRLAETVRRTGRVVQVGSQQRTMEINRFACEFVRDGGLGRITKVELSNYPGPLVYCSAARENSGPKSCDIGYSMPKEPVPDGLDWDLFCGPTEMRPYNRRLWVKDEFRVGDLLWRGWDLWRGYSGHIMTNWGAHNIDMAQYALGRDGSGPVEIWPVQPPSVPSIAAKWSHKTPPPGNVEGLLRITREQGCKRGTFPTCQKANSDAGTLETCPTTFSSPTIDERRFWPVFMRYEDGVELHFVLGPDCLVIHGERGAMNMRRNHFHTDPPDLITDGPGPEAAEKWKGPGIVVRPHIENWLDCVRTRETPNAPVDIGHRTVTICHLANIARELNRKLRWNPDKERFTDDDEANQLLARPRRKGFELPA